MESNHCAESIKGQEVSEEEVLHDRDLGHHLHRIHLHHAAVHLGVQQETHKHTHTHTREQMQKSKGVLAWQKSRFVPLHIRTQEHTEIGCKWSNDLLTDGKGSDIPLHVLKRGPPTARLATMLQAHWPFASQALHGAL